MRISNSIFLYSRNELPPEIQETPQPMASWRIMLLLAENYVAWDAHWAQTFASTDWVIWSRTLSCHDYQVTTVCLTCASHASHATISFGEIFLLLICIFFPIIKRMFDGISTSQDFVVRLNQFETNTGPPKCMHYLSCVMNTGVPRTRLRCA